MQFLKLALVLPLFIVGCTSTNDFVQGQLHCYHTTSVEMFGTAQVVSCEHDKAPVYVSSFNGTAGIEPIEHFVEAGAVIGGAYGC